jgi:hypothetical protein
MMRNVVTLMLATALFVTSAQAEFLQIDLSIFGMD